MFREGAAPKRKKHFICFGATRQIMTLNHLLLLPKEDIIGPLPPVDRSMINSKDLARLRPLNHWAINFNPDDATKSQWSRSLNVPRMLAGKKKAIHFDAATPSARAHSFQSSRCRKGKSSTQKCRRLEGILLMIEILHHLGYIKPINWCRISSINSMLVPRRIYKTHSVNSGKQSCGSPRPDPVPDFCWPWSWDNS